MVGVGNTQGIKVGLSETLFEGLIRYAFICIRARSVVDLHIRDGG